MIAVKSPPREVLTVKVCNTEDQGFLGHGSLHMGLTSTVLVSASLREVEKTGHSEKSPMDFFPFVQSSSLNFSTFVVLWGHCEKTEKSQIQTPCQFHE